MAKSRILRRSKPKPRSFRRVVLRGLTILLPPILTIVVLVWVINTIDAYVLQPVTLARGRLLPGE